MHEDQPQKKHRWRPLRRRNSNHNLSDENASRTASGSEASLHSSPRTKFSTRSHGLLGKLFGKGAKSPSAQSARQSSNSAPLTVQDLSARTDREPSPSTTLEPDPGVGQDNGSSTAVAQYQTGAADPNNSIADAQKAVAGMKGFSGIVSSTASATDNVQSGLDTIDKFSLIIAPLKAFTSFANEIGKIHPYAQIVMSILTCASKMILDQAQLDNEVLGLLEKVSEVYTFMKEDGRLGEIHSMEALFGKLARQTLECADFIVHYSETQSAWKRMGKHMFSETNSKVQSFIKVLDDLMQQFRDRAVRGIVIDVHRMAEDQNIMDMEYVRGAGRDTSKCCLNDTRKEILSKIKDWVDNIGEDVPRVFWLSGTAGKGKSAIAHTIANWFLERGDPGSCFCFDRTREAEHRHEKIFSTVARDLADRDPILRRALASAIHNDNELRHTKDITRQWKEFVLKPMDAASQAVAAPVLMVIDALDESGAAHSRKRILQMLAGKVDPHSSEPITLPANVRILVTSRPLDDIGVELDAASHVRHVSMDDLPAESTENDICAYISEKLSGPRNVLGDKHFKALAQKADGLFEWARLACEHIMGTNKAGADPMRRFQRIIAGTSSQRGVNLLDDMYHRILAEISPEDAEEFVTMSSVMAQVIALLEPLSMSALTAMRKHFPGDPSDNEVELVMRPLGSLFAGTSDSDTPIRPLHASFYDFLTDKSRSKEFFIDKSLASGGLAFASLRVMKAGLRFNICSLENSYLPNSAIPDLERRVRESIPLELSYSCRFWGAHVRTIRAFDSSLANEVKAFFEEEHLLFWLEALSLLKGVSGSLATLSSIADWVQGQVEYKVIADSVKDTQRFVRTFAPAFVHSTPHLYLSALPFAPTQSRIFRMFSEKFPRTPRVAAGHVVQWPVLEKILHANSWVNCVAVSQDGRRVVCGSMDGMIRVWDTETGEALVAFQGDTGYVSEVTISPDGRRIVSYSNSQTIRLWDVATGSALGDPLLCHSKFVASIAVSLDGHHLVSASYDGPIQVWDAHTGEALDVKGHIGEVACVAISPDGTRIVSGSSDKTIRVWDMKTSRELFTTPQVHTHSLEYVAFSADGKRIVYGSEQWSVQVLDADTGEVVGAPLNGQNGTISCVAISPDGTLVASGSSSGTIQMWDIETGTTWGAPILGHADYITCVVFSPDGKRIVSGSYDATIRIWDMDAGTSTGASQAVQEPIDGVYSVAMSRNGTRLVCHSDRSVRVWNMDIAKPLGVPTEHRASFSSVALSPDGKYFITGLKDGTIQFWDTETSVELRVPLRGHTTAVHTIVISKDGKRFASGSWREAIRVWDADTGKALGSLQGHMEVSVWRLAISPDGNRVVAGGGDDGTILVWDIETGRAIGGPLRGHTNTVMSVAISPDGKHIVSGSWDKTILVWNMETGRAVGGPFQGHTDFVRSVAISPNGKHIVSGSDDRTIRVWEMETGKALGAPFRGHTDTVTSVAISPDGKKHCVGFVRRVDSGMDSRFIPRAIPRL